MTVKDGLVGSKASITEGEFSNTHRPIDNDYSTVNSSKPDIKYQDDSVANNSYNCLMQHG